ncbi:hypothetical protein BGW36DRAFT_389928, partial [Talaromyces proteolyticus]
MKFLAFTFVLLTSSCGVQSAGTSAFEGTPAVNQGPEFENADSIEGHQKSVLEGLHADAADVCPPAWPRPCPNSALCCSDAYPWCCPNFCCPNGYPYCGGDGRCV